MSIFPETKLHSQLTLRLQKLKFESERLLVRQLAVNRYKQTILAWKPVDEDTDDEDSESIEDIMAHIEAIEYDLNIFCTQLQDRQKHVAKGIALLSASTIDRFSELLCEHFIEEADLCIRDAKVACEGYDELITDLMTQTVK